MIFCCTGECLCHCWPSLSQMSPQYCLSLARRFCCCIGTAGAQHTCSQLWELLWLYQLKASQFRPAWTSQAALRRKSKLTAWPPLTKAHSSWRAVVCSRSLCHHPRALRAPSTTASLSTHRSSCQPPWGGTHSTSHQGRGSVIRTAAALHTVAADQMGTGIFPRTSSRSCKQREELNLQLSPAMRESSIARRKAKSIHFLGNLQMKPCSAAEHVTTLLSQYALRLYLGVAILLSYPSEHKWEARGRKFCLA